MITPGGAIGLGTKRIDGGRYHAQWSIRPGVRANVVIPAEQMSQQTLEALGIHVVDTVTAPHGVDIQAALKGRDL